MNVLVSALLSPRGAPAAVVDAWRSGRFELVASPTLLDELQEVAALPRFVQRLGDAGQALTEALRSDAIVHDDPPAERSVPGDPRDDYLVTLARTAGADVIVTGDRHLLELEHLRPPVLDLAAFVALLDRLP